MNPDRQSSREDVEPVRRASGTPGLDAVLEGGFQSGRLYLIEGQPGTGKTTLALQFLMEGARAGLDACYITLAETAEELRATATSHGWDLPERLRLFELVPPENLLEAQEQSLLYASDLELSETTTRIFAELAERPPALIVLDSLSEIRLLAQSSLRYRRQILSMKHRFAQLGATVLLLDDMTTELLDKTVHSVAHAVIRLEEMAPGYGAQRRQLRVIKYRGSDFRGGYHDFKLQRGGAVVYPRLRALEYRREFARDLVSSGVAELDALLGGGMERGTSTLLLGPAGSGKSLIALTFVAEAIRKGEKAVMFVFDEEIGLLIHRAAGIGIDLAPMLASGALTLHQLDAAELSPGEFAHLVRRSVGESGALTVVIDSLNGYQAAMPEETFLQLHMHELLQYLNRLGTKTFLAVAQHGLVGDMTTPVDITYLADTVVLLRYFEALGRVRRAVSIIKKRSGMHEDGIREYTIGPGGLQVGRALTDFQGVLRGVPDYAGSAESLMPPQTP